MQPPNLKDAGREKRAIQLLPNTFAVSPEMPDISDDIIREGELMVIMVQLFNHCKPDNSAREKSFLQQWLFIGFQTLISSPD